MQIKFTRLPNQDIWRAYLPEADHIGGLGSTPQEAVGWMVLHHPGRFGITDILWNHRPPKLPHPEVQKYPEGPQEC